MTSFWSAFFVRGGSLQQKRCFFEQFLSVLRMNTIGVKLLKVVCVFIVFLIAFGCQRRQQEIPMIGRTSYILGECYLNNTNSVVDAVFTMPEAAFVFLVLVLEGVKYDGELNFAIKSLQDLKLTFTLSNITRNEVASPRILGLPDLGYSPNWHEPNAALVIGPPLINYGIPLKLTGTAVLGGSNAVERIILYPGDEYRIVLQVIQPGTLTNKVTARIDFMGVLIRL